MNWRPRFVSLALACSLLPNIACRRQDSESDFSARDDSPGIEDSQAREAARSDPTRYAALEGPDRIASDAGALSNSVAVQRSSSKALNDGSKKQKREEANALFDQPSLVRIQIDIPAAGISQLRRSRWEAGSRPVVKAVVREGDQVYRDVAVHLKGAAGSFRSVDDKPALTLNFDKFVPGQSFHGLHKISLNNSEQDPTYLCEKIARELFIKAGVPVPRASHAVVTLNGRKLGFYVLLEGANKQFLKRYFDNAKGNLFDGGFCRDIDSRLAVNCGEDPKNTAGLKALRTAVRDSGDGAYARLAKVLDVDRFVTMVAIEVILCHWDGYSFNRNNWRVFHDLDSNRMVFVPHGLDQLFGRGRQFEPTVSGIPQGIQGEVSRAVLSTREGRTLYRERMAEVCTNVFKADEINSRIDEIIAGVGALLAETEPQMARAFRSRANSLKQRILRRAETLTGSSPAPLRPIEFSSNTSLPLKGWKESIVQSGAPEFSEIAENSGATLLAIKATEPSSGSYRTRLVLPKGKYQLEGRVQVRGVTIVDGDPRGGAGLRISKGTMPPKLTGSSGWKDYKYLFEVEEKAADVELVCELKATAGEARFDLGSLRLQRLE